MSFMGRCFMRLLPVMTTAAPGWSTTVAMPDRNRALVPELPRYSSCVHAIQYYNIIYNIIKYK